LYEPLGITVSILAVGVDAKKGVIQYYLCENHFN